MLSRPRESHDIGNDEANESDRPSDSNRDTRETGRQEHNASPQSARRHAERRGFVFAEHEDVERSVHEGKHASGGEHDDDQGDEVGRPAIVEAAESPRR